MRRLSTVGLALIVLSAILALASPAHAQGGGEAVPRSGVVVVKVTGLLDPVLADFVERSIRDAEDAGAVAVVLQVKSRGSVVTEERFLRLADAIRGASVPIVSWVGPSGARVRGPVAQLVSLTSEIGISPGSRIGSTGHILVEGGDFGGRAPKLLEETVGYTEAGELGIARLAPTIGDFVIGIEGFESEDGRPITPVLFSELTIVNKMAHTVASPPVAYLLFLIGMGLLVFELFTAGVGVAGVVGAGSLVLGAYGLDVLPARWWAVALLVVAMFGFAVDIQIGVPRFWTALGLAALVVGSLALYDGTPMSWVTLVAGIGGTSIAMISGMPAMVRTRFSTPTIGREWMVDEIGIAESDIAPEGVVRVRDALWKARTNRATPITSGDGVRVVEISGLILEVEPEEGGARDYRERRGTAKAR